MKKAKIDPKSSEPQFEEVFTTEEVAATLKVTTGWVHQRVASGKLSIPYFKAGHYLRFPASGVRRYIEDEIKEAQRKREQAEQRSLSAR